MFKKILTGLLFVAAFGMVAFPTVGNLSNNEDLAWGGRLPDLIIKSVEPTLEVASSDQADEQVAWGGRLPDLIIKSVEPKTEIASVEEVNGEQVAWGGRLPDLIIRTQSVTHLS